MNFGMIETTLYVAGGVLALVFIGIPILLSLFYKKVNQGTAIVRNGIGGAKVSFSGIWAIPIFHKWEYMDVSVKRVEIAREGTEGLICMDNLRADIRVAFFVRVNHTEQDVLRVAKSLGTKKASDTETLMTFFDAKFSEALKTVGKKFDFVQLYTERDKFKEGILQVIGTDLNGYALDDAAIDYLEQTDLEFLNPDNVLDSEGIKKITDLTAIQAIKSNQIKRDKEKTIVEQDVSTRETILELEKQQAEAEQKQKREIENITARETSQINVVNEEERLKAENAKIRTDEELAIATENKERQVIIAQRAKEATSEVEKERVEKQKLLEATEKERLYSLAQIEKEKQLEAEKKTMQEVVRERVVVEKAVAEEEEKIKDTREFAEADRSKSVNITNAERDAQVQVISKVKLAEADKTSAEILAEKDIVLAETQLKTSYKKAESTKVMADAEAEQEAVKGLSDARVMKAQAEAYEADGASKAKVVELHAVAKAKEIELEALAIAKGTQEKGNAEATVIQSTGLAEAKVIKEKSSAEAKGIDEKAAAMKKFDAVGKEHEEFKLKLNKDKEIDLAEINIQAEIAKAQAEIMKEGLRNANVDIVGGESMFFDKLVNSITKGKQVDRMIKGSEVLTDVKETFFNGDSENFKVQLKNMIDNFNINTDDIKNLTVSAAIMQLMKHSDKTEKSVLGNILDNVKKFGLENETVEKLLD